MTYMIMHSSAFMLNYPFLDAPRGRKRWRIVYEPTAHCYVPQYRGWFGWRTVMLSDIPNDYPLLAFHTIAAATEWIMHRMLPTCKRAQR